jgi:hypothetical protein
MSPAPKYRGVAIPGAIRDRHDERNWNAFMNDDKALPT